MYTSITIKKQCCKKYEGYEKQSTNSLKLAHYNLSRILTNFTIRFDFQFDSFDFRLFWIHSSLQYMPTFLPPQKTKQLMLM